MADGVSSLPRAFLLVGLLATGFAVGFAIHPPSSDTSVSKKSENAGTSPPPRGHIETNAAPKPKTNRSPYRSADTLDDLTSLHPDELYPRLALWLADASPSDFEACWHALSGPGEPNSRILELIAACWTSTDPHAAINAAKGGRFSHIPWTEWGKNSPREAFEYTRQQQPNQLSSVFQGVAQSHPELALQLLDHLPKKEYRHHIASIIEGLTHIDPEAALKLISVQPNQYAYNHRALEAWMRQDPHAVFSWLIENSRSGLRTNEHDFRFFTAVDALKREHPELLAEIAASTPPGNLRRQLESAVFQQLSLSNPEAALDQARQIDSEGIAVDRFSQVALSHLREDPSRALEVFSELLEKIENPFNTARGREGMPTGSAAFYQLLEGIVEADPVAALDVAMAAAGDREWTDVAEQLAERWIYKDPHAVVDWFQKADLDPAEKQMVARILGLE